MQIRVFDLEFDEANAAEAARHGVEEFEIRQVLDNYPIFLPNKKGHAALVVMIGPTYGGRYLTVPLAPTGRSDTWRPASAWDSSDHDRDRYRAAGGARSSD